MIIVSHPIHAIDITNPTAHHTLVTSTAAAAATQAYNAHPTHAHYSHHPSIPTPPFAPTIPAHSPSPETLPYDPAPSHT